MNSLLRQPEITLMLISEAVLKLCFLRKNSYKAKDGLWFYMAPTSLFAIADGLILGASSSKGKTFLS